MSYITEIARSVRRYEPGDRAALRAFQRAQFGPTRHLDEEFFEWIFERNPHRGHEGPPLWVCVRDGAVVGQQASIPIVLKIDEREQRAAWLIDWMIDPAWRLKGVAPALLTANTGDYELMLGLGLEEVAYKTVARAGWRDVGELSLFVRPLDPEGSVEVLKLPKAIGKLTPRIVVTGTASAAASIGSALTGVSLEAIGAFDEHADAIWAATKNEHAVLVKRDLPTLRWRYDDGPMASSYRRYYVKRRGTVIGYAVLRYSAWRGHTVARVVDYLVPRRWAAPLFALLIDAAREERALAVFFEQWDPGTPALLRALGCVRARASHRFMFKLREAASPLASRLTEARRWFLVPGDSDFDHVLGDANVPGSAQTPVN